MKWLTNILDPNDPDAYSMLIIEADEDRAEAWQHHLSWLKDKAIGMPKATNKYSVLELVGMGMVGVYGFEDSH